MREFWLHIQIDSWILMICVEKAVDKNWTRPKGLLDPKIRDEMSDFSEIFPTENQI